MACFNPRLMSCLDLKKCPVLVPRVEELGWKVNKEEMKAYKILSKETRHLPLELIPDYVQQKVYEIPCGCCLGCRLDYSKDWANRCTLEAKLYDENYFITLTYDEDHIVLGKYGNPTIVKEHITQFIKDLRQYYRRHYKFDGIRYFGCQEYGDKFNRPHAHVIMFNLPIFDLTTKFPQKDGTFIRKREKMTGKYYFYSDTIQKFWSYGYICIADCNWNTEAYVSRYVMKKQKGKNSDIYKKTLGIEPPYLYMSTRPGIGTKSFLDNYDYYVQNPYLITPRPYKSSLISGLPRAFKKKIHLLNPSIYQLMIDKAKENELNKRSLIAGKQLINDLRSIQESLLQCKSLVYKRNSI